MKPIQSAFFRPRFTAFAFALLVPTAYGAAIFDFNNGVNIFQEGQNGIGGTLTETDTVAGIDVTITTVDIVGQDGSRASDGVANTTSSTNDAFGIISFDPDPANGNRDARDFNLGEQWVFTFDVDVTLTEIDMAGWNVTESEFTLSFSDGTPAITLMGNVPGNTFSLNDTLITAGVEVTMGVTNTTGDNEVRVPFLTVAAVPPVLDGDDLVWSGADGDAWNTVDANFTGDDTVFETGDNVEIQTAGAINIDAGGITAGLFSDTTAAGTVTLQAGDLTVTSLDKSGAANLLIASPTVVESGLSALSAGTLQVSNGAAFNTTAINLSGGSLLQVDAGGTLNVSGAELDAGGGALQTEEPVSIAGFVNVIVDNSFTKSGEGDLTITGPIGTQTSGTVVLEILEGSIIANTSAQLNIGSTSVFDGDFVLDGASVEFHGTTATGTGSIVAQSGAATINSRFNGGQTNVANDILLNSDLIVEAPTGDSEMELAGTISGVSNLVKNGNGIVLFTGSNTYTGTTTINSGALRIGRVDSDSGSGTLGTGAVIINETTRVGNLEFRRNDALVVDNMISGVGNIRQIGGPTSSTTLTAANDYTGVTELVEGTLIATSIADYEVPSSIGAPITPTETGADAETQLVFSGGTLSYTGAAASTNREFVLGNGGGTLSSDGTGPLDFNSEFPIIGDGEEEETRVLTLAGSSPGINIMAPPISDGINAMHAITKTGTTTWSLTGANTYTGSTVVEEGVLSLSSDFLADASDISISAGATLDLPHGATDTVGSLTVGGVNLPIGVYGAVGSGAGAGFELPEITGTGLLEVTALAGSDFDVWASEFGVVGGLEDDDDNDGLTNLQEYAFGLLPTSGASVNPFSEVLDQATGVFVYTRRNNTIFNTGLTYSYGSSTDLQGFTPFTPDSEVSDGGDPVETVTVTLPASLLGDPTLFVQITAE